MYGISDRNEELVEPYIIAEVGSNFNQSLDTAKKLIDESVKAKVNAVKFQLFRAEELYDPSHELYDIFKSIELSPDLVPLLKEYCEDREVEFMASAFDIASIQVLEDANVNIHKVASSEKPNPKLLHRFASTLKPTVISTGMCSFSDVVDAVDIFKSCGNEKVCLLQCTSLYPSEPKNMNLKVIGSFKNYFNLPVGLSDHSLGFVSAITAVGLGATIFEKHITLDRESQGPDHFYAMEPNEFREYVDNISQAFLALGENEKLFLEEEKAVGRREGLYAARDILEGEPINEKNLKISRPAKGIISDYFKDIVGARANRNIRKDEPIYWSQLEFGKMD